NGHQPEAPDLDALCPRIRRFTQTTQARHGVADHGHHDHCVGPVEGQVTVSGGQLRTVGVVVHRSQGVHEAPYACTEECSHGSTDGPQRGSLVRVVTPTTPYHVQREQHHGEERQRLQGGEDRAQPQPDHRRTDPEEVVTGTDNAGDQRHGAYHIEPLLDNCPGDTGDLDQDEGQHRPHDQYPHALYPQVHHKPPVVLVAREVFRVVEGEQEEHCKPDQTRHHHRADHGLATFEQGHADVVEEAQGHHHDADLSDRRLLQELPPHGRQQVVAGHLRQRGVGHQQVAENGRHTRCGKHPEEDDGQLRAVQFA